MYPAAKAGEAYTLPSSVTLIDDSAFSLNPNLSRILVDSGNTSFRSIDGVLYNMTETMLLQFPRGKQGDFVTPEGVNTLGYTAFADCPGLTSVTVPAGISSLPDLAFSKCANLRSITVNPANPYYSSAGGVLFNKDQTTLFQLPQGWDGAYTVPETVTAIGPSAGNRCLGLTVLTLSKGISSISSHAFEGCSTLTSVFFPRNLPTIFDAAFQSCPATGYYLLQLQFPPSTLGGLPMKFWNPKAKSSDDSFGVQVGEFAFTITGTSGIQVIVEACDDLQHPVWTALGTNTLIGGSSDFSDPAWAMHPTRLYRFVGR